MSVTLKFAALREWPASVPATADHDRRPARFKARWSDTIDLLKREVAHLAADDATLHVDTTAGNFRRDGELYADARCESPVVLAVRTRATGQLVFPCDRWKYWQDNVRAIALTLEALRAVNRYGASRTEQYRGYAALPALSSASLGVEAAVRVLCSEAGYEVSSDVVVEKTLASIDAARLLVRTARARSHPDISRDRSRFDAVQRCALRLSAHFGQEL